MTTYSAGRPIYSQPALTGLTRVGQAYLPKVSLQGEQAFQKLIPGTPGDYFAATFSRQVKPGARPPPMPPGPPAAAVARHSPGGPRPCVSAQCC